MKYVIVTGAFGGMGKAVTRQLIDKGYTVLAFDKVVGNPQENLIPIEVDITDTASVTKAYEKVLTITDKIYAIAHFAGIYALDSLVEMEE